MTTQSPIDSPSRFNPFRDYTGHFNKDEGPTPSLSWDSETLGSDTDFEDDESFVEYGGKAYPYSSTKHLVPFVRNEDRVPKWIFRQPSCNHQFEAGNTAHRVPSFKNLKSQHMDFKFGPKLLFVRIRHARNFQDLSKPSPPLPRVRSGSVASFAPDPIHRSSKSLTAPSTNRIRSASVSSLLSIGSSGRQRSCSNTTSFSPLEAPTKGPGRHTIQEVETKDNDSYLHSDSVDVTVRIAAFQFYNRDRFVLLSVNCQTNWLRIPDWYHPFDCLVVEEGDSTVFVWGIQNVGPEHVEWNQQIGLLLQFGKKVKVVEY
ncbi:hypothetical protein BJ508DRAFT_307570 [Ascobolus immersus RN42]|uniref:Uncharacterized protein n=1 Tax=Ascobolus immersus RN42 TaxID=1160509 RepID=A0A3N4I6Q6_ASCIM|nr:hypothetical protein BJ508DRAFT_307570 [Ascobolus immersus RN42]